ncbi:MAG: hypothetical protein HY848_06430, partial [Betaproteobacteria bacterium]|nr:hypothetical protein [Betaproteobacteria bacterium]
KRIRAQSTILDKTPALSLFLSLALPLAATKMTKTFARMWQLLRSNCITVFLVRMVFVRTKNTVGARSAQRRLRSAW